MTYNPYSLEQSYAQYGQAKKKQAANAKKTTPSFSFSNDNDSGSTYDEVPQTVTTGLGSKLSFDKPEDDRTLDQKIYESMKSFGASIFGKPEVKDTYILEAYNSDPMFVIPEPTPVVETAIDEGTYDFIDMSRLMNEPRQPRTEANIDTTPEIGGYDYAPLETTAPGLMSPPSMEQNIPNVPPLDYTDRAVTMAKSLPSAEYTIQVGDTLGELAEVTGSTVDELMALNNIEDKDRIVAGETIKIPIRRDEDAEIVTQATSMEELKPIKATYNPLALALPRLKPNVSLEDAIVTRLKTEEGFEDEAYKLEGEEYFTIGYGHYGSDVEEGQKITKKEAEELLRYDVQTRMPQIKSAIKNFDDLSRELQVEIAQSWFRGGIAGSPKTIALINEGKWEEASKEFLDNNEYRTTKLRGVKRRMKGLSDMLKKEADK